MIRKELTADEVARLAGCTRQQVRRAILSARLRARKVGREALIWDDDARAFAAVMARRIAALDTVRRKREKARESSG